MPAEPDVIFHWNNRTYSEMLALRSTIGRATTHITDALAKCHPTNPEADALRIALGILLGATTEATT